MSDKRFSPRLWVITECYPRPGAMRHCAFVHRQMVGLSEAGWDVRVLIPNGWSPPLLWVVARTWRVARGQRIPEGWSVDGIPVTDLTYQNRFPSRLCRPRDAQSRMAIALAEHLKKVDARPERDLLLVHFALPYGTVARRAARSVGIPYTIYFRGDDVWIDPHRDGAKRMTGFVESVSDADLVLAVSQSLIDEAARLTGKPFGRAAVVHNGIDLERFQPAVSYDERQRLRNALMISPDEVAVLCVGDALNRKGWIEILDALGSMRNPSIVLVAVDGGGKEEVDICAEAARRAPSVRLRYFRNLDAEHLADIYRATDIFCLLSHWEGLSNAVLEAMASGLAVVTTAVAGHPEIISDGIEGFLVPPRSAEAAKYAIVRLVDAPSLRERVGAAARRRAELIGDARKNGERLAGLLGGLLRDGEDSHARRNM